jgi:hypothetical protein
VVENLSRKCKTLNSIPSIEKKEKKELIDIKTHLASSEMQSAIIMDY